MEYYFYDFIKTAWKIQTVFESTENNLNIYFCAVMQQEYNRKDFMMIKKKDYNIVEVNGKKYTVSERSKDRSEVLSIPYSIETYVEKVIAGKISRDVLIQRTDDQWTKKQKSKLIEAILHNRPIGTFAIASGRSESKNYAVSSLVDGLQRTTAIVEYKQDKFALAKNANPISCMLISEDGEVIEQRFAIAGKKYSQLPEAIQMFFDEYRLDVYRYSNFTDAELDDIVFCMNNGKSPTSYQKLRFALGSSTMMYLQPMCDSLLWEDVKGCKAKNDSILGCVVRTLMMMSFYNYESLSSATMMKFADDDVFNEYVKTSDLTNFATLIEELSDIKMSLSDDKASRFDSVTIPHYIMGLDNFKKRGKTANDYADFLNDFWNSENFALFTSNCESNGSGSSLYSAQMVENRQWAINNHMDEYFDEHVEMLNITDEGDKNDEENNSIESETTGSINFRDTTNEANFITDEDDIKIMSEDCRACKSTSETESQNHENGNIV